MMIRAKCREGCVRKTAIALGAAIWFLAAEPLAVAAAVSLAVFQLVLLMGRGGRGEESDAKVYTVYRYDFGRHTRETVGKVSERRKRERGNNYLDLLRHARTIYSTPSMNSLILLSPD
jgi:hypothetical protein